MTWVFWMRFVPVVLALAILSGVWAPSVDLGAWLHRRRVRRELRRLDRIRRSL